MAHDNLWAPWRMSYLRELAHKTQQIGAKDAQPPLKNFLADYWSASPQNDPTNLVVYRNAHGIVLLNRYPYANGHLMAALGDPRPTLLDYEPSQRAQFWRLVEIAMELMRKALSPQGINMGINEGKAAGAGLPEHLHAHIVPRWGGDTNFMSVVGEIRVIPDSLDAMAEQYRAVAKDLRLKSVD
jgi:ATP adenylyltransferase